MHYKVIKFGNEKKMCEIAQKACGIAQLDKKQLVFDARISA